MLLIDSDKLKPNMISAADESGGQLDLVTVLQVIDDMPTEQSIPESSWEQTSINVKDTDIKVSTVKCFICNNSPLYNGDGNPVLSTYCPFCGALMHK